MALSKTIFCSHLKALTKTYLRHRMPPAFISVRLLSFDTPEDAAAERRKRKRRLRMEPPLSSLNRSSPHQSVPKPIQNPNAPKLPEHVSALSGNRLNLHNRILTLIRQNDLEEAALYTRHSVYSNCRPTIFTVNSVLSAQLRQSKYSELLSLHRFITQAGIAPNIITYNLIFQTYLDCRKPDVALEHYKQFSNNAPLNPCTTTYRILIKGLVDNNKLDKALELKEEMNEKGFMADPIVYHYLMLGHVRDSDADGVFKLYEELKVKLGGVIENGVVYGCLMKGYFMRGMEKEAMYCYQEALGEGSLVKMNAIAFNSILDALSKNGKFDEAMKLFDRMIKEHNPPKRLTLDLGSFNVMVDGYIAEGKYKDAVGIFRRIGEYRLYPDTLSFNNLIKQLCEGGMLVEAEEIYGEMGEKGVNPDEFTYVLLMDACFKEDRSDDAAGYFRKMVESGLRPNLAVYNRLADGLVKVGKVEEAKSFFDMMMKKLKMDDESYKFIMKTLSDAGKLDEVLKIVDVMLDDEGIEFSSGLQEFVKEELSKEGREDDLVNLMEEKERQKAEAKAREIEAAEAAKNKARIAVADFLPSKLFGNKETNAEASGNAEAQAKEDVIEEAVLADGQSPQEESIDLGKSDEAVEGEK